MLLLCLLHLSICLFSKVTGQDFDSDELSDLSDLLEAANASLSDVDNSTHTNGSVNGLLTNFGFVLGQVLYTVAPKKPNLTILCDRYYERVTDALSENASNIFNLFTTQEVRLFGKINLDGDIAHLKNELPVILPDSCQNISQLNVSTLEAARTLGLPIPKLCPLQQTKQLRDEILTTTTVAPENETNTTQTPTASTSVRQKREVTVLIKESTLAPAANSSTEFHVSTTLPPTSAHPAEIPDSVYYLEKSDQNETIEITSYNFGSFPDFATNEVIKQLVFHKKVLINQGQICQEFSKGLCSQQVGRLVNLTLGYCSLSSRAPPTAIRIVVWVQICVFSVCLLSNSDV